ncbi:MULTISPECIES: TetR/AcrR family transcriptional regulator [Agrobacterium]|uniref:TetR/AcrR family transcriptional regulator n=1 Tax=Agrobacterium TaxID=357 RepID=UPI000D3A5836|nr:MULTISPECIES: TetR/AcrR family transcriptional regulator [Agrobacterium]PTV69823.1 TetR/AcrR family transcriptional regulator [Agrobacterium pusense]TZG36518.1 TetR/AcrR family transcriptional regulator [Agrobacterium sp. B1(2019)]
MDAYRGKRLSAAERRTAILQAAATVFFEQGYAATSMDAIIERVGGSKRTIYSEFGNKEGLFTALVSEGADKALAALAVEEIGGRNLRETMLEFARRLVEVYMSPTMIGVYRAIMAEALRFPELAKAFYDRGPGRAAIRLAEVLEEAKKRGEIDVDDCRMVADQFAGMLRDNIHLQVVLGLRPPLSPSETERMARSIVSIFLDGLQSRAGRPD